MMYSKEVTIPGGGAESEQVLLALPNKRLERQQKITDLLNQLPDDPNDSKTKNRLLITFDEMIEEAEATDPDTGFYNKKGLAKEMYRLMDLANRSKTPLSILFIDGRQVKRINERVNYESGTRAILAMADAIEKSTRPSDIPARIIATDDTAATQQDVLSRPGGDEFVVLLYGTSDYGAAAVGHRIQSKLEELAPKQIPFYQDTFGEPFTVRVGIAQYDPSIDKSSAMLLSRADEAVKSAKSEHIPDVICVNRYDPKTKTGEIFVLHGSQMAFPNFK